MNNTLLVVGNTYPVKDQIKALGGRWDAASKGWRMPDQAKWDAAQALVAGAPKSAPRATSTTGRGRNWDATRFNGYGRPRGGYVRSCRTGGNCSSVGSGKSCGAHDCDGF